MLPQPPVFLIDGADVMAFRSVAEAEAYLEPWAVNEADTQGFDSTGRRLTFSLEPQVASTWLDRVLGPGPDRVRITLKEELPADPASLRHHLSAYLQVVSGNPSDRYLSMPLPELVAAMSPFFAK